MRLEALEGLGFKILRIEGSGFELERRGCGACLGAPHSYRGTSLIRNTLLLGPYSRTMPRVLGGS